MFESAAFPVIVSGAAGKIISKNSSAKKFMPKMRLSSSIFKGATVNGDVLVLSRDDTPFKNAVIINSEIGTEKIAIYLFCPQIQEANIESEDIKIDIDEIDFTKDFPKDTFYTRMYGDIASAFTAVCRCQTSRKNMIDVCSAVGSLKKRLTSLRAVGKRISVKCADIVASEKFFTLNTRAFLFSVMRTIYIALRASKNNEAELLIDYRKDISAIEISAATPARDDISQHIGDIDRKIIAPECSVEFKIDDIINHRSPFESSCFVKGGNFHVRSAVFADIYNETLLRAPQNPWYNVEDIVFLDFNKNIKKFCDK